MNFLEILTCFYWDSVTQVTAGSGHGHQPGCAVSWTAAAAPPPLWTQRCVSRSGGEMHRAAQGLLLRLNLKQVFAERLLSKAQHRTA